MPRCCQSADGSGQRERLGAKHNCVMRYDLIACFYEGAEDRKPVYSCPLGIYAETLLGDLSNRGFSVDPDSTPGYLDYIKKDASVEDIQELTKDGYISEVMDILYCGRDFNRIDIEAREIEAIDDEGSIPPLGFFINKTFVEFCKTEPFSPVWFIEGNPYEVDENTRRFLVPLKKLKDYFEVLTMYEVRERLQESFTSGGPWSFDQLKDYFEAGFDDAVDLATRRLYGLRDSGGQSQLYHSLAVGMSGAGKTEQLSGFLFETVRMGLVTLDELRTYGFSDEVTDTLELLSSGTGSKDSPEFYARIAASGNLSAYFVLLNYLQHNRNYAESIEYRPDIQRYDRELAALHSAMKEDLIKFGSEKEGSGATKGYSRKHS